MDFCFWCIEREMAWLKIVFTADINIHTSAHTYNDHKVYYTCVLGKIHVSIYIKNETNEKRV